MNQRWVLKREQTPPSVWAEGKTDLHVQISNKLTKFKYSQDIIYFYVVD